MSANKYNGITADKSEVMKLSPRTGRPTSNPKTNRITVRLDIESKETLETYCEQEQIDRAEGIRRAIGKLKGEIKK